MAGAPAERKIREWGEVRRSSVLTQAPASSTGISEAGRSFRIVPKGGRGPAPLYPCAGQLLAVAHLCTEA